METCTFYSSPLGRITLRGEGPWLTGLWLENQCHCPLPHHIATGTQEFDGLARQWLDAYFAQQPPAQLPPLRPAGTDFCRLVWQQLLRVTYGSTKTYGQLAQEIAESSGRRTSPRAVGNAVGRNPIALIIPCHRIVGTGGALTGYAGGLERKAWLLRHEGAWPAAPCTDSTRDGDARP